MFVRSIRLFNFRSHAESTVEFSPRINLIHGPNGAGKTNILEAIHYACLSKSFVTSSDSFVLRRGTPHLEVEAHVQADHGTDRRIRVAYARGEGKRVFVDGAPLDRLSDLIGLIPIVVYSPEDYVLTAGGPDERRRFLNNIMSQERPVFMDDLLKYRRAVRQRNELLSRISGGALNPSLQPVFLSWTAEFVTLAARIMFARQRFVTAFAKYLADAYGLLGEEVERPTIRYGTFTQVEGLEESEIADQFRRRIEQHAQRERDLGRTVLGPHRDELEFRLNELDVRRYASQGQHRTFGMALKVAQYLYLRDRRDEKPIVLLDDVFGNLDPDRTAVVMRLLESDALGQSVISATQRRPFVDVVDFNHDRNRLLSIEWMLEGSRVVQVSEVTNEG